MGAVYVAEDTDLRRTVALKLLPRHLTSDRASLRRFRREARAAASLNHPNIVTIHGIERIRHRSMIAMELVEGKCLDDTVPENGLALDLVMNIATQILEALAAAHDAGVVHRDLKGTNVMISSSGLVKVLDFGLAKIITDRPVDASGAPTASLPTNGLPMGTVPFMSPEQLRGEAVDHRADLFSFGVLLYRMLTGRLPFRGPSWAGIVSSILRDEPASMRTMRSDVSEKLEAVVMKCLAKNPEQRYQHAKDVLAGLTVDPCPVNEPEPAAGLERTRGAAGIAVLPFRCLSADPRDRFLSEGLMEEITNVLARLDTIRVVSRTTCSGLKDRPVTAPCLARELNVRYLLEGSVRRSGTAVRVTAQLIDAVTDAHVWSDTCTREADDIFALEDVIAQRVAEAVTRDSGAVGYSETAGAPCARN